MALADVLNALTDFISPVPIVQQDLDAEVYIDWDEVPLDEEGVTGDDSNLAETNGGPLPDGHPALTGPHTKPVSVKPADAKPKRRVVPFVRTLKLGMGGRDVVAVKRALVHAKVRKQQRATQSFGVTMRADVRRFQQRNHLKVTGIYDKATHAKLAPHFDTYGIWMLAHTHPPDPAVAARQRVVAAATLCYNHSPEIHYTQGALRMMGILRHLKPPQFPTYADCSAFFAWCYYAADLPDPNGNGYNGQGFTGTLAAHGRSVSTPGPADAQLYGHGPNYDHVIVAVSATRGISHGSEDGPKLVSLNYRSDRVARRYIG